MIDSETAQQYMNMNLSACFKLPALYQGKAIAI